MYARLLLLSALIACNGDEDTALDGERGLCDPLDPALCALPFPSMFYAVEDPTTPTGYRVDVREGALPEDDEGEVVHFAYLDEKDGFSTLTPLLTYLDGATLDGAVRHVDIGAYADDGALSAIVDAETGERVPHWVELDDGAPGADQQLLILRPAAPLAHGRRYVVGLRGFVDAGGAAIPPSEAFRSLRDGDAGGDYDVEHRRARFDDDVFPLLEGAGLPRGELQLAWDFVTVSEETGLGRPRWMVEDALDFWAETGGPAYTITEQTEGDCAGGDTIGRHVEGTFTAPLYTAEDRSGSFLTRGDDGWPYRNGATEARFIARVPCSLLEAPAGGLVMQYGHGLLGDPGEVKNGYLGQMAHDNGWVLAATTWTGMAEEDIVTIGLMLSADLNDFAVVPERSMQGLVQQVGLLELMRGPLSQDPALQVDGAALIDPDRLGYYGNSQGGILGGAYLALSPRLERGVLGIPGMPYSLLIPRSVDFEPFLVITEAKFTDRREMILLLTVTQTLWDPGEPAGWANAMGDKDVLIQAAIGDAQVTTLGAHVMARAWGADAIAPAARDVWGLEERAGGYAGSGFVEWRYADVPDEPEAAIPPDYATDTHGCPRHEPAAQSQIRDFVETGVINQHCDGVCEGLREGFCD